MPKNVLTAENQCIFVMNKSCLRKKYTENFFFLCTVLKEFYDISIYSLNKSRLSERVRF